MTDIAIQPALFVAHGSPMNAILDTPYSRAWRALGQRLPRPRAILAVSAHWETAGVAVTAMDRPRTIHDFGGFPQALFDMQYPAPGSPALAERVAALLAPEPVQLDTQDWGLDHGTWSVLVHMFAQADIPVVQLSLDLHRTGAEHLALARRLGPLRDEGVLVIGLGNIVHNLRTARRGDAAEPYAWAERFDQAVAQALQAGDDDGLAHWERLDPQARFAVPTPEHYLPLLYAIGLRRPHEPVAFPTAGIEWGSLSMRSAAYGLTSA
ncbi:4,5-DOPA dioxygenase extradiol [Verticiella sediminum]|uniref:4,5-DOPA dioxygenase extradiol n=1 Tax=Verticiella sediminum TaxID=1247510 RepID=A0A556AB12_9BURK|nr:4,5-DOPA dioxygenase extradiol [Verticiella sediminum]TSH90084.1 4,5-DOPA dioxygenase extradiol [Verticiella sediminum]